MHAHKGNRFTAQARQAAIEARRRLAADRPAINAPDVFIVRRDTPYHPFGWEIRRFGSIVLKRGVVGFATQWQARQAGQDVLMNMEPVTEGGA